MVTTLVSLAFTLALAGDVPAGDVRTVAVEGRAKRSTAADREGAVEIAKRDARKQAHAKALGMVVSSSTVVRNYAIVSDVVSEKVRGVILDETWSAPRDEGDRVVIALTARVAPAALAEGACAALSARHSARVAVVIATDEKPQQETANALLAELKGGCMTATLVNASAAQIEKQTLIDDVRARSAGELALFVKPASDDVNVTARIVDVASNEILAVATGNVQAVADALFKQVAKAWTQELNDGRRVTFTFATKSFAAAALVARGVAQALGVEESKDQALRDGSLRFSLYVPGDGMSVAKKLEGLRVGERTLTVSAAEGSAVTLAYAP